MARIIERSKPGNKDRTLSGNALASPGTSMPAPLMPTKRRTPAAFIAPISAAAVSWCRLVSDLPVGPRVETTASLSDDQPAERAGVTGVTGHHADSAGQLAQAGGLPNQYGHVVTADQ